MIELISKENLEELLPIIEQYQAFYQVSDRSVEKNRQFFAQFGEGKPSGCQFAFRYIDEFVGFATVYFTYSSTIAEKVAVLNDLYVCPAHRGQGIARQLLEHCSAYGHQQEAARLQWVTAPDNKAAQKLYDAMGANKSTWHFYTYQHEANDVI